MIDADWPEPNLDDHSPDMPSDYADEANTYAMELYMSGYCIEHENVFEPGDDCPECEAANEETYHNQYTPQELAQL